MAPSLLLVGGTGFVGAHLSRALVGAFPDHRRLRLQRERDLAVPEGWEAARADLLDERAIDTVIADLKPAVVVHLAAQSHVMGAAEQTWRVNFGGTLSLAAAVARHVPEGLFFFTSSGEVYGRSFNDGPATEDTCPRPMNSYASSKLAAEAMLRDVLPRTSRLIVARAFNHTGPGQDERFVIPAFAAQIARIEAGLIPPVMKVGNLSAERDFLSIGDVIDAYVRLLTGATAETRTTVNVSSGTPRKIQDLLDLLLAMARTPVTVEVDPERLRPSDIPVAVGNSRKLRDLTGWDPQSKLEDTVRTLLDWWRLTL